MPLMPLSSSNYSPVIISDFLLFSLRFHLTCSAVNSSMIYTISCQLFDITSMSSANASKSPLDRTSFNFWDDLIASSRYTLNSTGESTEPYGNPISALISCSPTWMIDSLWSLVSSVTIALSLSSLHLFSSNPHRISLSTESYAFYRSMRRLNFLFFLPCTSLSSLLAWIAVDLPSLNPVQYIMELMRCGQHFSILESIAFSIIFKMWDRSTIGLMSSNLTGPFVCVFCSGTNLPTRRYSGMAASLRA